MSICCGYGFGCCRKRVIRLDSIAWIPSSGFHRLDSGAIIPLKIGDVISGRNKMAELFGWHPSTYRDRLERLAKMKMVTLSGDTLCTVVSVTNFQGFQRGQSDRDDNEHNQPTTTITEFGRQPSGERIPSKNIDGTSIAKTSADNHLSVSTTTRRQPDDNPTTLIENVKNVKNEKKNTGAALSLSQSLFSEQDSQTAPWMFNLILAMHPGYKSPNLDKWADDIRLIRERDNRTDSEIRDLFRSANSDSFWRKNILSPQTLRKQWDKLTISFAKLVQSRNDRFSPVPNAHPQMTAIKRPVPVPEASKPKLRAGF